MDIKLSLVYFVLMTSATEHQAYEFSAAFLRSIRQYGDYSTVIPALMAWLLADELPQQAEQAAAAFHNTLKHAAALRLRIADGIPVTNEEVMAVSDRFGDASEQHASDLYRIEQAAGFAIDSGVLYDLGESDFLCAEKAPAHAVQHAAYDSAARRRIANKLFELMAAV